MAGMRHTFLVAVARWPICHMPFAGRCHRPARLAHLGILTRDMR